MSDGTTEIRVYPQDPGSLPPVKVSVASRHLLPGPIGPRLAVYEYNRDTGKVYAAARPGADGSFPEYPPDDHRFHQLNAYAIAARAIELTEMELGRNLVWGFPGSRLIILPHAGYLANAYYDEDTHSLQLFSYKPAGRNRIYHTCLSHDIVAHEMGHALLAQLRRHRIVGSRSAGGAGRGVDELWAHLPRSWPRITRQEAYEFLDGNRASLALSTYGAYRDFVVRDVHLTTRPPFHREIEQIVLTYEYPVEFPIEYEDGEFWHTIWGGGTLVYDWRGRCVHHAEKPVTRERIDGFTDFLDSEYAAGQVGRMEPGADDAIRQEYGGRPWSLHVIGERSVLRTNPAARCRCGPKHHAWIDFGNFHNDRNDVFEVVYADVMRRTGGKLDLLVITHDHLDHMEGFYSLRKSFKRDFEIEKLWYAHVTPALDARFKIVGERVRKLMPRATREGGGDVGRIYRNNFGVLGVSTKDRMKAIRDTLPCLKKNQHAIHRLSNLSRRLPPGLRRLRIEVLAPERNSRAYLEPLETFLRARASLDRYFLGMEQAQGRERGDPFPFSGGVEAAKSHLMKLADFARLHRKLQTGGMDLLAAANETRNNTSIVLALTYDDRRLLLAGDAEEKSWELMERRGELLASDLIKVAHHGSVNASPDGVFEKVLARRRRTNAVIVSTEPNRFTGRNEVPKAEVIEGWKDRLSASTRRTRFKRTDKKALGGSVSVTYR